jgi:hypothetical protein
MTLAPGHSVLGIHFSTTTSAIFFYLGVGLTIKKASKLQNIPCDAWQAALKHKWSDRYETMQLNLLGVLCTCRQLSEVITAEEQRLLCWDP